MRMRRYWAYGEVVEAWPGRRDFHDLNSAGGIRDVERRWDTALSVALAQTEQPISSSGSSAHSFINVHECCFKSFIFLWEYSFGWWTQT